MPHDHDSGYKRLFAAPEMMRDLLLGFVDRDWVRSADFASLCRVNGSYVSDDLRARGDDMVWKIRLRGEWFYIYLLLEFKSVPDRWMALRIQVYVGLLYQDLVARKETAPEGKLPPVLPIVLYNGHAPWRSADLPSERRTRKGCRKAGRRAGRKAKRRLCCTCSNGASARSRQKLRSASRRPNLPASASGSTRQSTRAISKPCSGCNDAAARRYARAPASNASTILRALASTCAAPVRPAPPASPNTAVITATAAAPA